jgi:hypothetical protein
LIFTCVAAMSSDQDTLPGAVFEAWLADLRVDDAAHARARAAWLRRQAEEEATLVGVLADLAERERAVIIETEAGHGHKGILLVVGLDFCALRTTHSTPVLIRYDAVASVRPAPGEAGPVGDRVVGPTATLRGALGALAGSRARVVARVRRGTALQGQLRAVGTDVMTLRLDDRSAAYVPLTSLAELSVVESG